ncbi:MAG: TIGR01777 family oxidoreductase [Planctomycetota bacterium]
MHLAITGASGFVGSALLPALRAAGHTFVRLVHRPDPSADAVLWHPSTGSLDGSRLHAIDAVIHLAGENVAKGRWTTNRRRELADSRGPATERLCRTLVQLPTRPRVLIAASATGFYGDRGDEELDERSAPGQGFLADVARAWEAGTKPAIDAGLRVVNLRIGMVLDPSGGAMAKLLPPFRLGLGGRLGHGRQWLCWITRHDLVRAIAFALDRETLRGPVLAVAPAPVTNAEFTRTLGTVLRRPTVLPVPAFALRLLLGTMADELLLASQRALPKALLAAGFTFTHGELDPALRALLAPAPH